MDIVAKLIGVIGAVVVVVGLINVLIGLQKWYEGYKNDDPNKQDSGTKSMVLGGVIASISGGVVAGILGALNAIKF
ncbi:hypothetical protein PT274_03425 [Leuconostocaceae bacterium ESL0958]|nr:hypothetical protein [Leuconostocaceae bacterium ESL0958]